MPILRLRELNWRRALAEVALIFIGITLALFFDNWNEERRERALERQLLEEMRDDLAETRFDLARDIEALEVRQRVLYELLAELSAGAIPDEDWASRLYFTFGGARLFAKDSAYRALMSQGLGVLSDPELRKGLTDFYGLRVKRIEIFEGLRDVFQQEQFMPFFSEVMQVSPEWTATVLADNDRLPGLERVAPISAEALAADPRLSLMIVRAAGGIRSVLSFYEMALADIDALLPMIDQALETKEG
jgi:hypothetical protein